MAKINPTALKRGVGGATALAAILGMLYANEGDYVNNKADRGGPTRYGVTQVTAREAGYLGDMRDFPKHCYGRMTTCADTIYVRRYVDQPNFTPWLEIDPPIAAEVVDTGVNMGPAIASAFLQRALNDSCPVSRLVVDGKIGKRTVAAYQACQTSMGPNLLCRAMLTRLDALQEARYRLIAQRNPSQKIFLKGWIAHRIGNVPVAACA